jgi:hypothetical protein
MRLRGHWMVGLCCLLICVTNGSAAVAVLNDTTPSMIVNPSFEDQGDASDRAAGWGRWGDWFNREEGWTPVRSGHCILGYHHWQIPSAIESGVYQDFDGAVLGKQYTFGIYVSPDKTKDGTKDALTIELRLESTLDGRQLSLASKLYKVADLIPDKWQKLSVSGAPVNNSLRVLVIVTPAPDNGTRGGALRFDDAFIEMVD